MLGCVIRMIVVCTDKKQIYEFWHSKILPKLFWASSKTGKFKNCQNGQVPSDKSHGYLVNLELR